MFMSSTDVDGNNTFSKSPWLANEHMLGSSNMILPSLDESLLEQCF